MTERVRSHKQASEMRFLRKIKGVTMFDEVRNTAVQESLDIESLLLRIEKSQLRWFGHLRRMPQELLPKKSLYAEARGKRQVGRSQTRWLVYIKNFGWKRLGLYPSKMQSELVDRKM